MNTIVRYRYDLDRYVSGAIISGCGIYRYALARDVSGQPGAVLFVMLNPSTADHKQDDPTIRRCLGFTRNWGFGKLLVANLFAIRSTSPVAITQPGAVGPDNDRHIADLVRLADQVIMAWGAHGPEWRANQVLAILKASGKPVFHLGLTKAGAPRHPLYTKADQKRIPQ